MEEEKYAKISLWVITKKWFWLSYDHIGWLILINFVAALASVTVVGVGLAFAMVFVWTYQVLAEGSFSIREGLNSVRKHWKWALGYGTLLFAILAVLTVNIYFYEVFQIAGHFSAWLAMLIFWFALIYLLFALWVLPTKLYFQESFNNTVKKAWILCFDNLKVSFAMFAVFLFWMAVGLLTGVFYFLLSLSLPVSFVWVAFGEVMKKYHRPDPFPGAEERTLRELVKPWAS